MDDLAGLDRLDRWLNAHDHYVKRAANIRLATATPRPVGIAPHQVSRVP